MMMPDDTKWESLICPICKRDEISFQEESIKKYGIENLLCWDCAMESLAALRKQNRAMRDVLKRCLDIFKGELHPHDGDCDCFRCETFEPLVEDLTALLKEGE